METAGLWEVFILVAVDITDVENFVETVKNLVATRL